MLWNTENTELWIFSLKLISQCQKKKKKKKEKEKKKSIKIVPLLLFIISPFYTFFTGKNLFNRCSLKYTYFITKTNKQINNNKTQQQREMKNLH